MSTRCLHRLANGAYCKRHPAYGTHFCSHHQGSVEHFIPNDGAHLHPLARLSTPEDVFDLIRESLNAVRLGRMTPGQAYAISRLASEWRKLYEELNYYQRQTVLKRQILTDLMINDEEIEAERAESAPPLPVAIDQQAAVNHTAQQPITPPLKPPTDYPGWEELYGRRHGDRVASTPPQPPAQEKIPATAAEAAPARPPEAQLGRPEVAPRNGGSAVVDVGAGTPRPQGAVRRAPKERQKIAQVASPGAGVVAHSRAP